MFLNLWYMVRRVFFHNFSLLPRVFQTLLRLFKALSWSSNVSAFENTSGQDLDVSIASHMSSSGAVRRAFPKTQSCTARITLRRKAFLCVCPFHALTYTPTVCPLCNDAAMYVERVQQVRASSDLLVVRHNGWLGTPERYSDRRLPRADGNNVSRSIAACGYCSGHAFIRNAYASSVPPVVVGLGVTQVFLAFSKLPSACGEVLCTVGVCDYHSGDYGSAGATQSSASVLSALCVSRSRPRANVSPCVAGIQTGFHGRQGGFSQACPCRRIVSCLSPPSG